MRVLFDFFINIARWAWEAVVFLSKTRKICKIVTTDEKGTMLLTRTLHNGRFEELMVRVGQQAKCTLTLSDLERFLNGVNSRTRANGVLTVSFPKNG